MRPPAPHPGAVCDLQGPYLPHGDPLPNSCRSLHDTTAPHQTDHKHHARHGDVRLPAIFDLQKQHVNLRNLCILSIDLCAKSALDTLRTSRSISFHSTNLICKSDRCLYLQGFRLCYKARTGVRFTDRVLNMVEGYMLATTDNDPERCVVLSTPSIPQFVVSCLLVGWLLISYIPQWTRIISRASAEGLSTFYILLGSLSGVCAVGNILMLPSTEADMGCCTINSRFACISGLFGTIQVIFGVVCFWVV